METSSFSPLEEQTRLVARLDAHPDHAGEHLGAAFKVAWDKTTSARLTSFEGKKSKETPEDREFVAQVCGYVDGMRMLLAKVADKEKDTVSSAKFETIMHSLTILI